MDMFLLMMDMFRVLKGEGDLLFVSHSIKYRMVSSARRYDHDVDLTKSAN